MKKSIFTFAAIAMVLSFTSCKETSSEKTEDNTEVMENETAVDTTEAPAVQEMDSVATDSLQVEENMNETSENK